MHVITRRVAKRKYVSPDEFTKAVQTYLQHHCEYSEQEARRLVERYSEVVLRGCSSVSFTVSSTAIALERRWMEDEPGYRQSPGCDGTSKGGGEDS
jgi:hypothetical protein